ncbi:unnamed protein product, partial [Phaeothamnion confervicola]
SCIGHVVAGGRIVRIDPEGHRLVSFGVRAGQYVVGRLSAADVRDSSRPFDALVSGTAWLVRDGVPMGSAGADGSSIVRGGEKNGGAGVAGSAAAEARVARTAVGHDASGNLLLVQV